MATTLLIDTFPPFPSLTLTLPSETPLADIPLHLRGFIPSFSEFDLALSLPSGSLPHDSRPLSALWADDSAPYGNEDGGVAHALSCRLVSLRIAPRLRGGKGGFGSQLRAAGGRMSSQKTNNNDSCRDLNGRRLSTLKEAKTLAAYLESEPERKKARQEAQRARLEKLEKRLGINGKGKEKADGDGEPVGAKRRFDDTEYLEQSRDIVDNVKSAVVAGMLKKKKKLKKSPGPDSQEAASSSSSSSSKASEASERPSSSNTANDSATDRSSGKVVEAPEEAFESPITTPATVASATLAAIGA